MAVLLRRMTTWRHLFMFGLCLHLLNMITGLGCPERWKIHGSSCYKVIYTPFSYQEAQNACEQEDVSSYVTVVNDAEENAFIEGISPGNIWLGCNVLRGTYLWTCPADVSRKTYNASTGTASPENSYWNWDLNQPNINNGDCQIQLLEEGGETTWHSWPCSSTFPVICELQGCPDNWISYEDNCYYLGTEPTTFDNAETACKDMGANLTSIHSEAEQAFHKEQFITLELNLWIGLRRNEIYNNFTTWLDGTSVNIFSGWGKGEPNNSGEREDCVEIRNLTDKAGTWNDQPCNSTNTYMCKVLNDKCALETHNCDPNATCATSVGSYSCTCNTGYMGDGITCTDKDECVLGSHNCDPTAACANSAGSYTCTCIAGYSGDGKTCTDKDECVLGSHNCNPSATCANSAGSYTCTCNTGYMGDGITCTDKDECTLRSHNCDPTATCANSVGSYTCTCNTGYIGDGITCTAVCLETSAILEGQNFTWPFSLVGNISVESNQRCQVETERRGSGEAERVCLINERGGFYWRKPVYIGCGKAQEPNLADIGQIDIVEDNVVIVTEALNLVTQDITTLDSESIANVSNVLTNIVNVNSINPEVTEAVVEIVNNLQFAVGDNEYEGNTEGDTAINKAAQLEILLALEQQITLTTGLGGNFSVVEPNIALTSITRTTAESNVGLNFIVNNGGDGDAGDFKFREENIMLTEGESLAPVNTTRSSISIPASVFNSTGNDTVGVSFFVQSSDILFPTNSTNQTVGGDIVSAVVVGVPDLTNLTEPVVLQFTVNVPADDPVCVSWDFNISDWTDEGCWLQHQNKTENNKVLTCLCNHLTNFAVLLTPNYDIEAAHIVTHYITQIGCGISMITLSITIFIFAKFRRLRLRKMATPRQILLHMCVALFFLYFVFIVGIDMVNHREICITVAVLLQFFTLASLMWMAVEARNMYVNVIRVFDGEPQHFVLKASIVAWGLPMLVSAISLGVGFHPNYVPFHYYDHLNYCFVTGPPLYYGVILPVGIVMLHNIITFGVVMYQICHPATRGAATSQTNTQISIRRFHNGIALSVLTGLTWAFGFFAIGGAADFFSIMFSICNSFQGFVVFYLFCFRQQDVRYTLRPYFAFMLGRQKAVNQQRPPTSNPGIYSAATNFSATIPTPISARTEVVTESLDTPPEDIEDSVTDIDRSGRGELQSSNNRAKYTSKRLLIEPSDEEDILLEAIVVEENIICDAAVVKDMEDINPMSEL